MFHDSMAFMIVLIGCVAGLACSGQSGLRRDGGNQPSADASAEVEGEDAGTFTCLGSNRMCTMTEVCWIAGGCCEQLPLNDAGECDDGQPVVAGGCGVGRCALPFSRCVASDAAPAGCENMAGTTCHTCPFPLP